MHNSETTKVVLVDPNIDPNHKNLSFFKKIFRTGKRRIAWLACSSFLFTFGIQIFLIRAETFSAGLSAVPQLIGLLFDDFRPYIFLAYFGLNLPLIIIFWKRVKRSFLILTVIWMVLNAAWGFLLEIEVIHTFLTKLTDIGSIDKVLLIYVYASLSAICSGLSLSITFKQGASSGGTDIIAYYFSVKHKKNPNILLPLISIIFVTFSVITFNLIKDLENNNWNLFQNILGAKVQATFLHVVISSFIMSRIYPKYKAVKIIIHSKKYNDITKRLKEAKYAHTYTLVKVTGGYSNEVSQRIETYALLLESNTIVAFVREVDPDAWISVTKAERIVGRFNTSTVD